MNDRGPGRIYLTCMTILATLAAFGCTGQDFKQKNNLAAKVKEEQALRSSLPALSRQIVELPKTRGEITVKEIEESTGANRNTVKAHLRKLASDNYLARVGKGRGARYTLK